MTDDLNTRGTGNGSEDLIRECEPTEAWATWYGRAIAGHIRADYPDLERDQQQAFAQACGDLVAESLIIGRGCSHDRAYDLAEVVFCSIGEVLLEIGGTA